MKPPPSAGEMETALHRLLRKHEFNGQGYVHVVVVGLKSSPIYLVTLGADAAKVLGEALAPLIGHADPSESHQLGSVSNRRFRNSQSLRYLNRSRAPGARRATALPRAPSGCSRSALCRD